MNRKKIIRDLDAGKEYVSSEGRIYFLSINKYPASLPEKYYVKRREELRKYFSDRDEKEQKRLVLENLSLLAVPLEKDYPIPKIEIYRYNLGGFTFVVKDYAADDPVWGDNTDIILRKSLRDARTGEVIDLEKDEWRTERNDWLTDFAIKVRDKLRKGMNV
jgi:hypothetical protein